MLQETLFNTCSCETYCCNSNAWFRYIICYKCILFISEPSLKLASLKPIKVGKLININCVIEYPPRKSKFLEVYFYKYNDFAASFTQKYERCSPSKVSTHHYTAVCGEGANTKFRAIRTYTLRIFKVELTDAGHYFCQLKEPENNLNSITIQLYIFSKSSALKQIFQVLNAFI